MIQHVRDRLGFRACVSAIGIAVLGVPACSSATNVRGDSVATSTSGNEPTETTPATRPLPPAPSAVAVVALDESQMPDDSAAGRDARPSTRRPRKSPLLVVEIQGLENLVVATSEPAKAALVRRIAEDYVELEHSFPATSPERADARQHAIARYLELTTSRLNDPRMDEVLYYLALEYERANDGANARREYFNLIQRRPNSKFIPAAYLAFGELFFDEASNDPGKWPLARAAYQKVVEYPPPDNAVYGYAWYKLGRVSLHVGEPASALSAFQKVVDYGAAFPQLPNAAALAARARNEMLAMPAVASDPP